MKKKYMILSVFAFMLMATVSFAAFDSADFAKTKALEITRITPDGDDVPAGRQIVIQFNQPVVPLGRMDRTADEIPVVITPELKGQWRWLNTSALAYQLDNDNSLKLSTRYNIVVHPGIKTEKGSTLEKKVSHSFITRRPTISYKNFFTWKSPGMPVLRVTFNQSVSKDSAAEHLYMKYQGESGTRVALNVDKDPNDYQTPTLFRVQGESHITGIKKNKPVKSDDEQSMAKAVEARRIWLFTPVQELPLDTAVELKVEPGLISAQGPEKGITDRVIVSFDTFPEFKFLGIRCYVNDDTKKLLISADNPSEAGSLKANPLEYVALVFSAPVIFQEVKNNLKFTPDLAGGRNDYDPWANSYSYSGLRSSHKKDRVYTVRFPELLKAFEKYHIKETSFGIKDEFGRKLIKPIDFTFYTDHRKPDFNLVHSTAVLEDGMDTKVPVYVTNIGKLKLNYNTMTTDGGKKELSLTHEIADVPDVAFARPLGVRGMLQGKSGAVYGSIESEPYIQKYNDDYTFFVQVTPYQLHVKSGHFNTVVWVTDLSTGKPVSGADITIYKSRIDQISSKQKVMANAITGNDGTAILPGNEKLDPELSLFQWGWNRDDVPRLIVQVVKNEKMAVLPLAPRFEVDMYRISNYSVSSGHSPKFGHIHTWGTTAQGVYRAGDTIQYKVYVRNQDNESFVQPPLKGFTLTVIDPTGKDVYKASDIELSEFGACDGEFTVPETGAVGWYRFELTSNFTDDYWIPMSVLVSDFTPSPFRVSNELNGDLFKTDDEVEVVTFARLHAGGPYTEASTRVVARITERPFFSKHPHAKGFTFGNQNNASRSQNIYELSENLDDKGDLLSKFTIKDKGIIYGRLMVESAVQDDRGKYVATVASADYSGRTRFVGLRSDKWIYKEDEPAGFRCIVVDENGVPAPGVKTKFYAEHRVVKASRVKGAGNAYLTHYTEEWVPVDDVQLDSKVEPLVYEFTPEDPGSYRITAEIRDTKGRTHSTKLWAWVVGKGRVVWEQPDNNSLKIIPEEESYAIGDTARYLVKNPYPGATALISIERYGVLKHWVQKLETSAPVIEFPVEPDYLPGFFLSVIVMSPRVDKPLGEGNVDLGKPSFRAGYVSVDVNDPYKKMVVDVLPEKEVYKPGDTVKVSITAKPKNMSKKEPVELAVAVLDEAVFDLLAQGKGHFDPYSGFYSVDGLDLVNYSLLMKLVGIQKFEKKGANAGGDGGSDISMRSVFKFVSYWNPSLKTDEEGSANIEFKVPDNLTGWRVFVMAVTPTDRMGLGDNGFKVNRPTEVRPVMPNQVTEGDSFKAGFSVMNRTDKPRVLEVTIRAEGSVDTKNKPSMIIEKTEFPPYKRKTIWLPVHTTKAGDIKFSAKALDKTDGDGLMHHVPVKKRRSLETAANYGTTTRDSITEKIRIPEKIHDDVGYIGVVLSPAVIGNVEGAFRYMKDYPYICWEQKLSKGIMASHYVNLKDYISDEFSWDDAGEYVQTTLNEAGNFQAPNGGMGYYKPENQYVSPYLSAYTALAFNWLKKSAYSIPVNVEEKLHLYLDGLLKRDVLPDFYSKGMSSTVRAVALAALAESGKITVTDLKRYKDHVPFMSLFGKAMFMQAALKTHKGEKIAKDVCKSILSQSSQTGGKFIFNEVLDDSFARIHASPIRANAAILSAFLEFGEMRGGEELVGDIPFKLVRYLTQTRGSRDHWENTQENMFCMNALIDYSRIYENVKPDMVVTAKVNDKKIGKTKFKDFRDDAVTLKRSIAGDDPGKERTLTINRKGDGRLYYSSRVSFAPLDEHAIRLNAGIDLRKEISVERDGKWVILDRPFKIKRGELVRVDLFLSLPAARNFVVVDDPVPGGLEPVNRDLATASVFDAEKGDFAASGGSWWFKFSDWHYYSSSRWSFYHRELRHDSVRFYSDWLAAGNYHLSYTAQAIAEGEFASMPVHAEEMYDPDVFGKGLPGVLKVSEKE